ncbi:diguanylate cyclase [uncultured Azonexus sp.]|uniref:GGDEF domain-containing response regulator n=1 Tax=uncultured Azonexus sp. TaxID=520307 RepID=UPI00261CC271|nr:diguanylate cyclase [uncultured Azonexus sp.]
MSDKRRILIVDPSRVARTALVKHLRDDFDIREESDGESAWQTLVLDASIVAVVSAISLTRTSGYELLSRLRENRLQRLSDMPFFLLISKDETAPNRDQAKDRGVSDFIVRGMAGNEIRQRIGRLVNWDISSNLGLPDSRRDDADEPFPGRTPICRKLCADIAAHAPEENFSACCVALGIENEQCLIDRFGTETMVDIGKRIARVIGEKIGRHDMIGHTGDSSYVIVSPGTSQATAIAFAQRVCRAFSERKITIGDQQTRINLSAGIAASPADGERSAAQLIDLALARLDLARKTPGNPIVARDPEPDDPFVRMQALLRQDDIAQRLGQAGLELLPMMHLFEQQFRLGLPLAEMEAHFRKHAGNETPSA